MKQHVLDIEIKYHDKVNDQKVTLNLVGAPDFDVDNPPADGECTVTITPDFSMEPPIEESTPDPTGFLQYIIKVLAGLKECPKPKE